MQIWTNYETFIFKKWGTYSCDLPPPPVASTVETPKTENTRNKRAGVVKN